MMMTLFQCIVHLSHSIASCPKLLFSQPLKNNLYCSQRILLNKSKDLDKPKISFQYMNRIYWREIDLWLMLTLTWFCHLKVMKLLKFLIVINLQSNNQSRKVLEMIKIKATKCLTQLLNHMIKKNFQHLIMKPFLL